MPLASRRIVMGAGVYDRVTDVIVWQIGIVSVTIERELQDAGARQLKLVAEQRHVRSDGAQILDYKWQAPQFSLDGLEKTRSWTRYPLAILRCLGTGRYVPGSREAPEVIQANHVYVAQQTADSLNAPPK